MIRSLKRWWAKRRSLGAVRWDSIANETARSVGPAWVLCSQDAASVTLSCARCGQSDAMPGLDCRRTRESVRKMVVWIGDTLDQHSGCGEGT